MSYLDYIRILMDGGCDEETACRMADMEFNPEYDPDDYDGKTTCRLSNEELYPEYYDE